MLAAFNKRSQKRIAKETDAQTILSAIQETSVTDSSVVIPTRPTRRLPWDKSDNITFSHKGHKAEVTWVNNNDVLVVLQPKNRRTGLKYIVTDLPITESNTHPELNQYLEEKFGFVGRLGTHRKSQKNLLVYPLFNYRAVNFIGS